MTFVIFSVKMKKNLMFLFRYGNIHRQRQIAHKTTFFILKDINVQRCLKDIPIIQINQFGCEHWLFLSIKTPTTPLIIKVHFYPQKYEFADCTILGDFAYISYLCLFIYLWQKHRYLQIQRPVRLTNSPSLFSIDAKNHSHFLC